MRSSSPAVVRKPVLAGLVAAMLAAAFTLVAPTVSAFAAVTTLYASPSGSGTACTSAQPCSLTGAQTAVRSLNASMSDHIVVELADGIYRLSAPLRLTAADSGNNGYTVRWQAAAGARPTFSGARAVTGWTVADSGKNIWRANVGTGIDTRQLYVNGNLATRARTQVNRADFTATTSGLRFSNSALSYLNNLANQNRVEMESVNSFTDRYVTVQSISGNFITMQQPGWNNNTFGYDTFTRPHRAGPLYLQNAYEFLDAAGEWYINPGTGVLYYIPASGQNINNLSVELPVLQSLVNLGGTYDAPAHHISFSGITFTGTTWLGPSSNQGFVDQQTGSYIAGNYNWPADRLTSCQEGCSQFESTRPNWFQMPAALQISAANNITVSGSQFFNLGQTAIGIGNDANAHGSGVGLGTSDITITGSEIARSSAGGVLVGGVRADAHHPSDQRMVNRNVTISNNRIHDLGLDYRGIVSVLTTYVSGALISHNEVYNLPYTGMSLGYGWGANDAGGSNHYADRGLYNYQPRYSTATTASGNQLVGNYIHDVMQQMTDGGCIYTLSANPNGMIRDNYCLRTNGYFGLYFDEGSRYYTATNNVFSSIGTWATANYWFAENMGNFTVTNNWTSSGSTNVTNGDRGNVVYGNVTVSNNQWPSGAQSVMSSAGPRTGTTPSPSVSASPSPSVSGTTSALRGVGSNRCLDVNGASQANGAYTLIWDCNGQANQRWTSTAASELRVYGNKCLDVNGGSTANGAAVIIWDCNGQNNQKWRFNSDGTITAVGANKCLDVSNAGTANGSRVHIWTCLGTNNQKWTRV